MNPNLLFVSCRKSKDNSVILYDLNHVNEKPRFGLLAGQTWKSKSKGKGQDLRIASVGDGAVMARFSGRTRENDKNFQDQQVDIQQKLNKASKSESQQRLYFSIDYSGRWLVAGNREGQINAWKIESYAALSQESIEVDGTEEEAISREVADSKTSDVDALGSLQEVEVEPDFSWKAHEGEPAGTSVEYRTAESKSGLSIR